MYQILREINSKPKPFEFYTAAELWTNEHTAKQMLKYHLNEDIDLSSRNKIFIEKSVEWIHSHFKLNENSNIADFGCGPGLYTIRLAEKGSNVTGIDFSKNSIQYAQKVAGEKGLTINYVNQNYLDFDTNDRYDLITMIFCDFCALSPEQRKILLSKFHKFLKPGGSVLLDVHSLNIFNEKQESAGYEKNQLDGFWSADDYYCFVNSFKYEDEKVSLDKFTIIEEKETRVVYNWLQFFSKESISKEFENYGFIIENVYSDVAGADFDPNSSEIAIIAKKS